MKNINFKKLFLCILITFIIGGLFAFLTMDNSFYKGLEKPFDIPMIIFPIAWSIIYTLMGISLYIITNYDNTKGETILYFVQLVVNSLWTLFFFGFRLYFFSFIWLLLLIALVIYMIFKFYQINKTAAYINIPYLLWLIFASYLNYMIYYLN